jgi:Uma2 family endonuclease
MSDMAGSPHTAPAGAGLTYEDLVNLPEDGKRYEILDGDLVVTASPLTRHQRVSRNLEFVLHGYVREHGLGEVFDAPIDVLLDRHTIVVPDLVFVSNARSAIVQRHGIVGVPDLLVEILSPSTADRDRDTKAKLYARFGVDHYWIVDADKEELHVYARSGVTYGTPTTYGGRTVVRAAPFADLALDLGAVWQ